MPQGVEHPTVTFVNEKKVLEVPPGANLRDEALKAGIDVYQGLARTLHCPGWGLCGTCRVLVTKGMENLTPQTIKERIKFNLDPIGMFAYIGHEDQMRLSCQVQVKGDCTVETHPAFNLSGENFWQKPYPNK